MEPTVESKSAPSEKAIRVLCAVICLVITLWLIKTQISPHVRSSFLKLVVYWFLGGASGALGAAIGGKVHALIYARSDVQR